jgi:hypothetical protein
MLRLEKAKNELWEILVPTIRPSTQRPIRTRFHRVWDAKVREISGGLTILSPVKGQWVSAPGGGLPSSLCAERMIPVRISCTRAQIEQIIDMTLEYYEQKVVMCYRISDLVIMRGKK